MTDLQEAFREAACREFAMVPDESELDYTFSPGFQRKMQRIIRAQVHGYWNMVNTVGKRIAIAAAIIVMLLTTAMAIKPIRERVIQFFVEVYEEYFEIRFGSEEKDDINPIPKPMARYTISHLPVGYSEIAYLELDSLLWTSWQNELGDGISLQQEPGTQEITLNNTKDEPKIIMHEGKSIACQFFNETSVFIWEQDGYLFYLTVHSKMQNEELFCIIDSVQKTDPTKK